MMLIFGVMHFLNNLTSNVIKRFNDENTDIAEKRDSKRVSFKQTEIHDALTRKFIKTIK